LKESIASLDPDIAHKIRSLFKEEARGVRSQALLHLTQHAQVDDMCHRTIFSEQGKIVAEGNQSPSSSGLVGTGSKTITADGPRQP
jgi:ABC-type multidrug transport system ATPase subunit